MRCEAVDSAIFACHKRGRENAHQGARAYCSKCVELRRGMPQKIDKKSKDHQAYPERHNQAVRLVECQPQIIVLCFSTPLRP